MKYFSTPITLHQNNIKKEKAIKVLFLNKRLKGSVIHLKMNDGTVLVGKVTLRSPFTITIIPQTRVKYVSSIESEFSFDSGKKAKYVTIDDYLKLVIPINHIADCQYANYNSFKYTLRTVKRKKGSVKENIYDQDGFCKG